MFTGLIEAVGRVISLEQQGEQARLMLDIAFAGELKPGDSVSINGCCLTVTSTDEPHVSFDLLKQTLKVTSLGDLVEGDFVNLERAMKAGGRFGGHFVQGHVDCTSKVVEIAEHGQDHVLSLAIPDEIKHLVVDKGSVAVEGISLTVAEIKDKHMSFWITPHTWEHTNLGYIMIGKRMNLEVDMLAKYVEQIMAERGS